MTQRWLATTLLLGITSKYAEKEGLTPFVIYLLEHIEKECLKMPVLKELYKKIQLIKVDEISIRELAFSYRNMVQFCGSDAHSIKEAVDHVKLPTSEEEKQIFESGIFDYLHPMFNKPV